MIGHEPAPLAGPGPGGSGGAISRTGLPKPDHRERRCWPRSNVRNLAGPSPGEMGSLIFPRPGQGRETPRDGAEKEFRIFVGHMISGTGLKAYDPPWGLFRGLPRLSARASTKNTLDLQDEAGVVPVVGPRARLRDSRAGIGR